MRLGRRLDRAARGDAASVGLVDLVAIVDLEGEVLDPHLVVPVDTAVCAAQPKTLHAVFELDDLFSASVRQAPVLLLESELPEKPVVEGERSLDVSDRQVYVLDPSRRHARTVNASALF